LAAAGANLLHSILAVSACFGRGPRGSGTPTALTAMAMELLPRDAELRLAVYEMILRSGRVPSVHELAKALATDEAVIRQGLHRLNEAHAFVLSHRGEILMAHPFSAIETPYTVVSEDISFRANCAWDALAIPAMLNIGARVDARCHCSCMEPIALEFHHGVLAPVDAVVHFAVPPRRFYDDVRFT
jgi:hypothetical protein